MKHKRRGKAVFVQAMDPYGEIELQLHSFLNLTLYESSQLHAPVAVPPSKQHPLSIE